MRRHVAMGLFLAAVAALILTPVVGWAQRDRSALDEPRPGPARRDQGPPPAGGGIEPLVLRFEHIPAASFMETLEQLARNDQVREHLEKIPHALNEPANAVVLIVPPEAVEFFMRLAKGLDQPPEFQMAMREREREDMGFRLEIEKRKREVAGPAMPMQPGRMGPGQMGPRQMGPGQMGPGAMGPGQMGPGRMGPGAMRPGAMQPGQMGPRQMGPGQMGPGAMGRGRMGPMQGLPPPMAMDRERREREGQMERERGEREGQMERERQMERQRADQMERQREGQMERERTEQMQRERQIERQRAELMQRQREGQMDRERQMERQRAEQMERERAEQRERPRGPEERPDQPRVDMENPAAGLRILVTPRAREALGLSEPQVDKIQAILEEASQGMRQMTDQMAEQIREVMKDTPAEARPKRMRQIMEKMQQAGRERMEQVRGRVFEVLTPPQREKAERWLEEVRPKGPPEGPGRDEPRPRDPGRGPERPYRPAVQEEPARVDRV